MQVSADQFLAPRVDSPDSTQKSPEWKGTVPCWKLSELSCLINLFALGNGLLDSLGQTCLIPSLVERIDGSTGETVASGRPVLR
jgi:hypothetical protein